MLFTEEGKVVLAVPSLQGDIAPDCPRCHVVGSMLNSSLNSYTDLACKHCGYVTPDAGFYLVEKRKTNEPDTVGSARAAALQVTKDKLLDINNELDDLRYRLRNWERAYANDVLCPSDQEEITDWINVLREMFIDLYVKAQLITQD